MYTSEKSLRVVETPVRYFPFIGGVEKYTQDLSEHVGHLGNHVTVICANEPKDIQTETRNGVTIKRLRYLLKVANTNITPFLPFMLLKEEFDLIHTHIPTPWTADMSAFVAWIKRKPLIVTYHNDIINDGSAKYIALFYNHTFLRFLLKRASAIIVTQKKYIESSKYLARYRSKIVVIPNGVNMSSIGAATVAKAPKTIFFLSSLDLYHRYKGLDVLIKAVAKVKEDIADVKLLIGGAGELVPEYQRLVSSLSLDANVTFLGRLEESKKNEYFQQASVFVLPSVGYEEGFGIVLLEAMANKTAVITTDIAGVADEIIEKKAGLVVKKNDVDDLAQKITLLLTNPSEAKSMGERGHQLVADTYAWDKIALQMQDLYLKFM